MKAITIHQPWAGLISIGAKRFETRGWKTNYRGTIAIHASKKDPMETLRQLPAIVQKSMFDQFYAKFGINADAMKRMPTGAIVATANLSDCFLVKRDIIGGLVLLESDKRKTHFGTREPEFTFGDYTYGRYAWELTDVKMLDKPIPAKGQQGLWNWN